MKFFKFLISLMITLTLGWFCHSGITLSSMPTPVPPLGKLLNPFSGIWQNAESVTSSTVETLNFPELEAPVKVAFDEKMVPHIFAQNMNDAAFVQGYITAQHRLWQMDFGSRYGGGRLAEVLGEVILNKRTGMTALDLDKLQRRRGLLLGAQNALSSWKKDPENFAIVEAYANGVNAYIKNLDPKDYPIEFKLMNYEPEEWNVLKAALISKNMALTLCSREDDLEATNALSIFGKETFDFLFPEYNPKQKPIIPTGTAWNFDTISLEKAEAPKELIGLLNHQTFEKPDKIYGSNNWAVSGLKTASGNPILCSDPHLRLTLPSVWYEIQIHTPEINAYGVSLPGLPGIIIGFNENIAWGQTNVGQDVLDWYRIKWTNKEKTKYEVDGIEKKVTFADYRYKVKGKEAIVVDSVKYTIWGPVVYESEDHPMQDLAMRWVAMDPSDPRELSVFNKLNGGKNYDDYIEAIKGFDNPAQNYAFASKDGDVAITVGGKFPLKRNGQGKFVQDGSKSENAWQGWIPKSQVPMIKNPERGFIASANQHSTDPSYPYYYNSASFDDYRGRHLVNSLTDMENIGFEDMMALQNDNFSLFGKEGTELLLRNLDTTSLNSTQSQVLRKLQNWNFRFEGSEITPVLFTEWWSQFFEMTWDEFFVYEDSIDIIYPENWRTLEILEQNPENSFFDNQNTLETETASDIVTITFKNMCDSLSMELKNPSYNWAQHKGTTIQHLGNLPGFSSNMLEIGGYRQALNAISRSAGPSWRMIVELGNEIKAYGVYPGGQSGNPGSKYYDSMLDKWANGEYYELFFMKNADDNRQPILFEQTFEQ